MVSFIALDNCLKLDLLSDLVTIVLLMLGLYLAQKVVGLVINGSLGLTSPWGWLSFVFIVEMVVGVLAPMFTFGNRVNVALLGLRASSGAEYFPYGIELMISAAAIVVGVLLSGLALRLLPGFQDVEDVKTERSPSEGRSDEFDKSLI